MAKKVDTSGISSWDDYSILKELLQRKNDYSPDFLKWKNKDYISLFTYGSLKVGQPLFPALEGCPYLGEAAPCVKNWKMWTYEKRYPVAMRLDEGAIFKGGQINGDLFLVPPKHLLAIDQLECNGLLYQRELVWVWAYEQKLGKVEKNVHPAVRAWMYVGRPAYWKDKFLKPFPATLVNNVPNFDWDPRYAFR